jgi:hypothetical protein
MALPISQQILKNFIWQGLSVALAAAVVLVFLGPALDHHFAERQHDHSHTFLTATAASLGHPGFHPFEGTHSHVTSGQEESRQYGVLYQTTNDGLGESGSVFLMAAVDDGFTYPIPGGDSPSHALAPGESAYSEANVAPPKRPPRA